MKPQTNKSGVGEGKPSHSQSQGITPLWKRTSVGGSGGEASHPPQDNLYISDAIRKLELWGAINSPDGDGAVGQVVLGQSAIESLAALLHQQVIEAERNGVAWAIGVIDDCHFKASNMKLDGTFKGIKNTIRDRFEAQTGVDPAPNYPIEAKLRKGASNGK